MDKKTAQIALKKAGYYTGPIDGKIGPKSQAAIRAILGQSDYSPARQLVAAVQVIMKAAGENVGEIDGLYGPMTERALESFIGANAWRPDDEAEAVPPRATSPNIWPRKRDAMSFFGRPGTGQTKITLPFKMRLAWNKSQIVSKITLHKKVAPSAEIAFQEIFSHYGKDGIRELGLDLFGGSLNVRKIRGGRTWSTHAWGCAIDFDPERNGLRTKAPHARLSHSDAVPFWEAWERQGWVSLGRTRNYDWMHIQAMR